MIKVTVKIGGGLCGVPNKRFIELDINENIHVADLLMMLSEDLGKGVLEPTVLVVLNGTKLSEKEKEELVLKDRDILSIFGALVGG